MLGATPTEPGIDVGSITLPVYIGLLVHSTDVCVVLHVDTANGRLSDDQSWVVTDVSGEVRSIVYRKDVRFDDKRLSFSYDEGGEVTVNGVHIRAGMLLGLKARSSYLTFLNRRDGEWYPEAPLFEITKSGRLVDPLRSTWEVPEEYFPELVLNNARLDIVLKLIRDELKK